MLIETVRSVFAHVVDAVEIVMLDHARRRSNAMAVRHIEDLPVYLRRDIGILDDAEIGDAVERGGRRTDDRDACRPLAIVPHAV